MDVVGRSVIIRRLQSRPDLNGLDGKIASPLKTSTGRVGVHIAIGDQTIGVNVRPQNLEMRHELVPPPTETATVKRMRAIADRADELYEQLSNDVGIEHRGGTPMTPGTWLWNESRMRTALDEFRDRVSQSPTLSAVMLSDANAWYAYHNHMYTSYPVGFGDALRNAYETNSATFNAEDTFERLTRMSS